MVDRHQVASFRLIVPIVPALAGESSGLKGDGSLDDFSFKLSEGANWVVVAVTAVIFYGWAEPIDLMVPVFDNDFGVGAMDYLELSGKTVKVDVAFHAV